MLALVLVWVCIRGRRRLLVRREFVLAFWLLQKGVWGTAVISREHARVIYDTRHADACWRNPAQDDFLGPPAKFMKFTNLKNAKVRSDGNMYGINGAYFYGPQAVGDYTR